jgi:chromosome segregation protein
LETKRGALQAVENDLRQKQEALREKQAEAFAAAQQLSKIRNEITALNLQKEGNAVRLEKLSSEKIQLEEERTRLEARLQQFSASVEAEKQSAQTSRGSVEEQQQRLREIQQQLTQTAEQLDDILRQQAEKRSRLNVLEQLHSEREGFSAGAVAALKTARNVLGSLADKIKVPDQYVVAIGSALGHNLQLVLTQTPETAQEILDDLRANKKGRASIAVLNFASADGLLPALDEEYNRVFTNGAASNAVRALSIVEADDAVKPLVNRLLGRTVVVRDLALATSAWQQTKGAFNFVTPAGEVLDAHGVFTGGYLNGSGNGQNPSSILGRRNQITELQSVAGQLQQQVTEMSRRKGALLSEQAELQRGVQQAQTQLRSQEVAIATREGEFKALQNSGRVLQQKIETVVYEVTSLAGQEDEGARPS